jgi:FkbM family methyltransferase
MMMKCACRRLTPLIDLPGFYPPVRYEYREAHSPTSFQVDDVLEPTLLWYLDEIHGPFTMLDIGANLGMWALYAANRPDVRVHTFEPFPVIFEALSANIRFLGLDSQVTASPLAFSNATGRGELTIAQSKEWFVPSLVPITAGKGDSYSIPISLTTVDDYVSSNQLSDVKFIKIDTVRGHNCKLCSAHE